MALLDTTPDFGQLLRQQQWRNTMSFIGQTIGALGRKARGENVQIPIIPGTTTKMPPPTPLLAGSPTSLPNLPDES